MPCVDYSRRPSVRSRPPLVFSSCRRPCPRPVQPDGSDEVCSPDGKVATHAPGSGKTAGSFVEGGLRWSRVGERGLLASLGGQVALHICSGSNVARSHFQGMA
eukprot:gene2943-biopygen21659